MISIQTNVNSLVAQQNLSVNSSFQSKTIQQLTSGYRINQSGDDAAGLAVANKFRSTIAELTQGVANGNDATAQLQIMDGGMNNISLILDRLKTLATQSASGTFTGNRTVLNSEFQNALSEIDRQAQSIGLNTGGLFAKNLDVFLGAGSGSTSLQNGIVTLGLTQSAVDSQSLGMRGMLAVNLTSGSLSGTNGGTDIGSTSATSVQNIVGNVTGANSNQQATAGYAAMQFSGAGFADSGKVSISVNLAGVTDVATLATAVNSAIQSAGNGTTASATAFKNANIVASLHTDSSGGQQLAFSSGTAAFQVQAGDQMANALLGKVAVVGGVAKGTKVTGTTDTTVTGASTTAGNFSAAQTVKLVVTGGGLAGPVTLEVNTTSQKSTTEAITDLENQFSGSAALQAAGLSMSGSSTVGGRLSFNTANGQGFNIQVTGDTANLLGLGSFLAGGSGQADYTTITAGAAYSNAAVTGSATTTGMAAGLEISLNGQGSTALTAIDLTAGAHAVAASSTSTASIQGTAPGNGPGTVDITALNQNLDITVTNNGVATNKVIALTTNTIASQGVATSTVTQASFGSAKVVSAALLNNSFTVAVDGATAQTVTLRDSIATGYTASTFLAEVQNRVDLALGSGKVTASYADVGLLPAGVGTGALTLTSKHIAGVDSSVSIAAATTATSGTVASGTLSSASAGFGTSSFTVSSALQNDKFMVSKDGGTAVQVTVAPGTTYNATSFLAAVNTGLGGSGVIASWDALNGDKLTLTSGSTGDASKVVVSAATYASAGTVTSTSSGMKDDASFAGYDSTLLANSNQFTVTANGGATKTVTLDGTFTADKAGADSFLTALNNALGTASTGVTASWDATSGGLALTSGSLGPLSSVVLGSATYATAAVQQSTTVTNPSVDTLNADVTTSDTHNSFNIALDGGPTYTVAVANGAYSTASGLVAAINAAINSAGAGELNGKVTASFNAAKQLVLTDTNATTGLSSSLNLSATTGNDGLTAIFGFTASTTRGNPAAVNTGLTTIHLDASTTSAAGDAAAVNGGLAAFGLAAGTSISNGNSTHPNAGLATMGLTAGLHVGNADGARSAAFIAGEIQTAFGNAALVTVSNDYMISIASTTKGANSTVVVNTPVTNSANATLHLVAGTALGQNSSIGDIVDNLNAQFAANSTYQAAGLTAAATLIDGTGSGSFVTIQSNNSTQFRLNSVGAAADATAGAVASTVTSANIATGPITVLDTGANHQFNIAVDGGSAVAVTVANGTYNTATTFLNAVNAGINSSTLNGLVTAGWDATTNKLTLTSATTGAASSVTVSAVGTNAGLANLGFAASTNSGHQIQATENTGFGVAGSTFVGAAASSTGTAMSAVDAFGISNSQAFTFSAMKFGNDKQALTFSATDANGVLETKTITLQNNASVNRAGASIDDAVAYINTQLQQSTSQPALQQIVAVKENVNGQEKINFVSSLSGFTVGVAGTANADGLNGGVATQVASASNGDGANMQVDSKEAAKAAVTAIATAIGKLGSAQAAVGKGQNQLYYAVNLAQSQITNFSAAESYIRDANVAQQAANLTKAQVLSQASIAAMAQANSAPQAILSLLRG